MDSIPAWVTQDPKRIDFIKIAVLGYQVHQNQKFEMDLGGFGMFFL